MFRRFRQLKIPLAAKCQFLFGTAVLLIIAAALFVPWQRMEQLVGQMNQRRAQIIADWYEADHVQTQWMLRSGVTLPASADPSTRPATMPATTRPATFSDANVQMRLFSHLPNDLSRIESGALHKYQKDSDADPIWRPLYHKDAPSSFGYVRLLEAKPACIACHAKDLDPADARALAAGTLKDPPRLGLISVEFPYQDDQNQVFQNRIFIFLAGVLAGTLAIIVFYLITTRFILGPVRVLQETAEKVSKGDLNIRSDISTGDEFQQLSETLNRMLANLQQSEDQLRSINMGLDMKLGELAESNLALYESNRLKSEFLANVSHELRTPLNSILGFADLLKDGTLIASEPKSLRYLQNIITSGKNLLALITDLLDLAKIEAGRMEVRSEPLSLSDLFEGLTTILKPLAEKKELNINAAIGPDVPPLQSDPAKLQQILYNFLSNAIKFSPERGRIDLKAERQGEDYVKISVMDQGPGIEPDKQSMIFEKFRQIDGSVTRQHGGTGLGLAISKELTGLLGGSIGVMSRPGEGATFWVALPLKIAASTQSLHVMVQNS
jgi:two-component system sensor histidine kinase BarA